MHMQKSGTMRFAHYLNDSRICGSLLFLSRSCLCVCVFFSASSAMQTNFNVQVLETRFYLSLKDGLLIRLKVDLLWTWNKYTDLIANSNKLAEKPFCKQFQLNWPLIFNLFFLELRLVHEPQNHIDFYHSSICHGESMKTKHFGGMIYFLCVSNLAGIKINWLCIDLTCCCVDTERGGFQSLCLPEYIKSRFVESKNRFLWILGYTREYLDFTHWLACIEFARYSIFIYIFSAIVMEMFK